jgi:hypothetical protein
MEVYRNQKLFGGPWCEQQKGIDYEKTFAPIVKWAITEMVVALATQQNWSIKHLNTKTIF